MQRYDFFLDSKDRKNISQHLYEHIKLSHEAPRAHCVAVVVEFALIGHLESQPAIELEVLLRVGEETYSATAVLLDVGDNGVHQHLGAYAHALAVGADGERRQIPCVGVGLVVAVHAGLLVHLQPGLYGLFGPQGHHTPPAVQQVGKVARLLVVGRTQVGHGHYSVVEPAHQIMGFAVVGAVLRGDDSAHKIEPGFSLGEVVCKILVGRERLYCHLGGLPYFCPLHVGILNLVHKQYLIATLWHSIFGIV